VGVRIDQSGEQRPTVAVDPGRRSGARVGVGGERRSVGDDLRDPFAIDDDVHVLAHLVGDAVDQPDRLEDRAHRAMLPTGPACRD
jgi:hypothetical protein